MHRQGLSAQSAMEYLMTYGWAILIIAVVLGALFGLGFFNSANLAPKIGPGACQVYRPQGPGTTSFINLEGTCNNELPQYVAKFSASGSSLPNFVNVSSPVSSSLGEFTIAAWVDPLPPSVYATIAATNCFRFEIDPYSGTTNYYKIAFATNACYGSASIVSGPIVPTSSFSFLAITYNGATFSAYMNGAFVSSQNAVPPANAMTVFRIGADGVSNIGSSDYMKGQLSNVQLYNTSLSANEVAALYDEGIGGVPASPQNLVGWWPLNGNANDYSGNLNNGVSTNVVFTSSWTSGYTAP